MQESGSNGNEGTTIDELSHLNITENLINPIKEAFKIHKAKGVDHGNIQHKA